MKNDNLLKQTKALLKNHPIFSSLEQSELDDLAQNFTLQNYQAGDWIVHHGDIWPHLFLIKSGQVTAIKESFEGRSLTLTTIDKGEIFWGLAFFIDGAPMPAALHASKDC